VGSRSVGLQQVITRRCMLVASGAQPALDVLWRPQATS
jgi:hypothetical protein